MVANHGIPRLRPFGWLLENFVIRRSLQKSFDEIATAISGPSRRRSSAVAQRAFASTRYNATESATPFKVTGGSGTNL